MHYIQAWQLIISLIQSTVWDCITIVSHLDGKHNERHKDHDDHQELWGPDLGGDISKAHRGEGDHAEVERVEEGQVVARSFEMLDAADADGGRQGGKDGESMKRKWASLRKRLHMLG